MGKDDFEKEIARHMGETTSRLASIEEQQGKIWEKLDAFTANLVPKTDCALRHPVERKKTFWPGSAGEWVKFFGGLIAIGTFVWVLVSSYFESQQAIAALADKVSSLEKE